MQAKVRQDISIISYQIEHQHNLLFIFIGGFKKFGKPQLIEQIDEVADDLESQHLKEIMGISEFGRKAAKSFDIVVSVS